MSYFNTLIENLIHYNESLALSKFEYCCAQCSTNFKSNSPRRLYCDECLRIKRNARVYRFRFKLKVKNKKSPRKIAL